MNQMAIEQEEQPGALDVIVRLHDPTRIAELSRCLFSLVCQVYQPIRINLCTQRFSATQQEDLRRDIQDVLEISPETQFQVLNFENRHPHDARSCLLNLGLKKTAGRYVAFLDYDDVIFPQSYQMLIDELKASGAAIAFGRINVKHVNVYENFVFVDRKETPFKGNDKIDLFRGNFCPIHSFVIDRSKVEPDDLYMDPNLTRNEDYDLLLRICAAYPASFRLKEKSVGDYYYKDDGSNTIETPSSFADEHHKTWATAAEFINLRRNIVIVSADVQKALGFEKPDPKMTIRNLLDRFDASGMKKRPAIA
jgi:hypothetical protein